MPSRGETGTRFGVLCNPLSGRARRNLEEVRRLGRGLGGPLYREVSGPSEIAAALPDLTRDRNLPLCILGGDGTVQATLTALNALEPEAERWPPLAVLPGGTTNMIAADLGADGSLPGRMRLLHSWSRRGGSHRNMVRRAVLRLGRGETAFLCGMFFGTGTIAAGVEFWEAHLKRPGLSGRYTSVLAMARILASLVRPGGAERGAQELTCSIDGGSPQTRTGLVCLATTLERLLLNTRPFWGGGPGALHFTLIEKGARRFWWNLPRLARGAGGGRLTPDQGYLSCDPTVVELVFDGPFVLDGELFHRQATDGSLTLSALEGVRWLVP